MGQEVNVLALVKGSERYIFLFDDANRTSTLRMLGRYAADPELSLTWYDAAVLSQKIRDALPAKPAPNEARPTQARPNPRFTFDATGGNRLSTSRFRLTFQGLLLHFALHRPRVLGGL